jgi:hypothetical protein
MAANTSDFLGEGLADPTQRPDDPDDLPNPANPGGISNNELRRRQAENQRAAPKVSGYQTVTPEQRAANRQQSAASGYTRAPGNTGGATGAHNTGAGRDTQQEAVLNYEVSGRGVSGAGVPAVPFAGDGASVNNPQAIPGEPPGYTTVDYSRYDQAAQGYDRAVNTFQAELDRLSGVDPFGNQAFLRKATDRAAAQAQGIAAGGLSTATARAGNMRQALGTQAALSAQGRDEQAIQRSRDENAAAGLRLQAAGGMANTLGAKAANEVELAKLQTQTAASNLDAYLKKYNIDATLKQQDVESLRRAAIELATLDANVRDQNADRILQKYGIDQQTAVQLKQIAAGEDMSTGEFVQGLLGAGAGLASAAIVASDRRAKFDVRDPDLRDLQDFLGRTKGKLYRYKDPHKSGRREGLNYGPMAQDLAKSKIGRTVVTKDAEGTLKVDTARLALADHAALAELAREVAALKASKENK